MTYTYIDNDEALINFRQSLYIKKIPTLAMDFEAEFKLHKNETKLCLIQIYDSKDFYIIDPLNVSSEEIRKTLEDRRTIKLFYGAGSDRSLVLDQYNTHINSLFDLKVLVDTIGIEHRNLDFVLEHYLGVSIDKKKKFQKHDWTVRPIDKNALEYALSDVAYLFELKDVLVKIVSNNNLIEEALYNTAKSANLKGKAILPKIFRSKEYQGLSNIEQRRFSKIYFMRDELANDLNIPPANIINNQLMLEFSKTIDNIGVSIFYKNIQRTIAAELILKIKEIWKETV